MYRVTTPTHTLTLPIDTATCDEIQVTYKQDKVVLVKHYENNIVPDGMTLDGEDVVIKLTQEETKKFKADRSALLQVRVRVGENVYASRTFKMPVGAVLNEEILTDES